MPRVSRSQLWNKPGTDRTGEISGLRGRNRWRKYKRRNGRRWRLSSNGDVAGIAEAGADTAPTDPGNGNLLSTQAAAAGLAVNVQMRADEAKLKQVRQTDDVLQQLMAIVAEEQALAEERRKLREMEGSVGNGSQ